LIERIAILEIKNNRFADPNELDPVGEELAHLRTRSDRTVEPSDEVAGLVRELKAAKKLLWQIEDEIRLWDTAKSFCPRFMELA
jgi:hypothetical protein